MKYLELNVQVAATQQQFCRENRQRCICVVLKCAFKVGGVLLSSLGCLVSHPHSVHCQHS